MSRDPLDANRVQFLDATVFVADKLLRLDQVLARVGAEDGRRFFLAVIHLVNLRPLRPRIVGRPFHRRFGHNLELHEAAAAVAHRRADAIGAGVAAANDDHVFSLGGEGMAVFMAAVQQTLGVAVQEVHREMDALEMTALRLGEKVVRIRRAAAKDDGVESWRNFSAG